MSSTNSTLPETIVGYTGTVEAKEIAKYISHIVTTALDVKPSECVMKNYDTITKNAVVTLLKLFPALTKEVNALISKFTEIQEEAKKLVGVKDVGIYADIIINIFAIYNVDPGIYGTLAALQAVEAYKMCGENDMQFFLARTLLSGSLAHNMHKLLIDYLNLDHKFPVNLLKAVLESMK